MRVDMGMLIGIVNIGVALINIVVVIRSVVHSNNRKIACAFKQKNFVSKTFVLNTFKRFVFIQRIPELCKPLQGIYVLPELKTNKA